VSCPSSTRRGVGRRTRRAALHRGGDLRGGHRATLWGFGVLLALVDLGLNRRVTTITSVSGGSIANGVVGKGCDYSTVGSDDIRDVIRPAVQHVISEGLFFYGPTTNGYLTFTLATAAITAAVWGLIVAVLILQALRVFVDLIGWTNLEPLETMTLWPLGAAVLLASLGLAWGATKYSGEWNWGVGALSILGTATGVGLIIWDLINHPIQWDKLSALAWLTVAGFVLTALLVALFGRRSQVAQRGLQKTHFGAASLGDLSPPDGEGGDPPLVLCHRDAVRHTCVLHRLLHLLLFIWAKYQGGRSATCFRGASIGGAARRVRPTFPGHGSARLQRRCEAVAPGRGRPMVLSDGGVYDNMADQWFMGLRNRRARWPTHLRDELSDVDDMIIANASTGWSWQPFGNLSLRIHELRELGALTRIQSVMYNTIGRRRRSHLLDYWKAHKPEIRGAFVEVNDNPADRTSDHLADRVSTIAPPDGWDSLVEATRDYPTVLRKVPRPIATNILWHAYLITALSAHRFFGTPVSDSQLPTSEQFALSLGLSDPPLS
jgi:hypothetical protein